MLPDPPETSDPVGEELREFFIDLLRGQNLQQYRSSGRDDYITVKRDQQVIGEEAEALLREGTLAQIEERIGAVTGSGNAVPVFVVCPPM